MTTPVGFAWLYPPYNWVPRPRRSVALRRPKWIPAPRFHEDKLRGNDPPEADRGLGVSGRTPWNPPLSKGDGVVRMKRVQGLVPAGSPRVSLNPRLLLPPRLGTRGLKTSVEACGVAVHPASGSGRRPDPHPKGLPGIVHPTTEGVCVSRARSTSALPPVARRCRRRPPAEGFGVSPNSVCSPPKSGGQGVEKGVVQEDQQSISLRRG